MPDYEYSDVKMKDFIAALEVYLRRLEEQWRGDRSAFQKFWWNINPAIEDVDDAIDRLYNEIMDSVETQGISPNVGQALSPIAAQIYDTVLKTRAKYDWQKQYGEAVTNWQTDVQKAVQSDWANRFAYSKEMYDRDLAERKFQWQQQQAEWQRKTQAQQGMWGDWRQEQELQQARRAALSQGIGRRLEAREAGQWEPQGANKERIWEATQREMIGQLDPDIDWLKIREMKQMRNPWTTDPESATDERHWAEGELEKAESWAKTADAMLKAVKDPESYLTKEEMEYVYQAHAARDRALKRVATATQKEQDWIQEQGAYAGAGAGGTGMETATGITYGGGAPPRIEPERPKTPEWLARGAEDFPERLPEKGFKYDWVAPSAQYFKSLTPSQQQRWAGAVSYYGGKPQELLWQTRRTLPQSVLKPLRWTAEKQMA